MGGAVVPVLAEQERAFLEKAASLFDAGAQVTVEQGAQTMKTYIQTPPNVMPRFYEGRNHQGVQRRIRWPPLFSPFAASGEM